ncbi:MAG: O-linked N-acetylglucosamine transferase, SPINDLY family protein [Planktothrix sp. GU0601_MAG3]|nr:MAG: O-linked N-acetylglucosamine transferase, SPINDLY family protein [Planktothrix sp. GU0601_MAG3]
MNLLNGQQQAIKYLETEDYSSAKNYYEERINHQPEIKSYYWYLGLFLLLQGEEVEAQTTWLLAMTDGEPEDVECWTQDIKQILELAALQLENKYDSAWLIRQHIREISPDDINNLLNLINLSFQLKTYTGEDLTSWGIIEQLQQGTNQDIDVEYLLKTLDQVLNFDPLHPQSYELSKACIPYVNDPEKYINILLKAAFQIGVVMSQPEQAGNLAELGLYLDENNLELIRQVATFYQDSGNQEKGVGFAKKYYSILENKIDRVFANYLIIRGLIHTGYGQSEECISLFKHQKYLLDSYLREKPNDLTEREVLQLYSASFFLPYFQDNLPENLLIRHKIAQVCQRNIENQNSDIIQRNRQRYSLLKQNYETKPLKIGYVSHCLRTHSVGWLTRWLFQYHNRENFKIYAYLINAQGRVDDLQNWYVQNSDCAYEFPLYASEQIINTITKDELDIIVDLDSITLNFCCKIMALKLAPIQLSWLGWDASEVPTIDYFIADPYVLPENAQDHYQETIWRLPKTYIAVDGFEISNPSLRREHLNIPSDAIVFLTAQSGYKYNLETAKLQMQIIKSVPNSYFLIKDSIRDQDLVSRVFDSTS